MRKIFVSSTVWDLVDLRSEIHEFLSKNGFIPIMSEMPDFPDDLIQHGTYEKCRQNLLNSDIFLLILNTRYGGAREVESNRISITHQEFRWALDAKKDFICFVRDKVESDYQLWKRKGMPEDPELLTLKEKNWRVLQILDEVQHSAPDGSALWWQPFKDSNHLKRQLGIKLGINDFSNNYIAQAQSINALPKLSLFARSSMGDEVNFELSNIGSSSACNIVLIENGNLPRCISTISSIPNGSTLPWTCRFTHNNATKQYLTLRYNNIIGSVFESTFELEFSGKIGGIPKISEIYFGTPQRNLGDCAC